MTHRNIKVRCKHICWRWKLRLPISFTPSFSLSYFLCPSLCLHTYRAHKGRHTLTTVVTTKPRMCPQPLSLTTFLSAWISTSRRAWSDSGEWRRYVGVLFWLECSLWLWGSGLFESYCVERKLFPPSIVSVQGDSSRNQEITSNYSLTEPGLTTRPGPY